MCGVKYHYSLQGQHYTMIWDLNTRRHKANDQHKPDDQHKTNSAYSEIDHLLSNRKVATSEETKSSEDDCPQPKEGTCSYVLALWVLCNVCTQRKPCRGWYPWLNSGHAPMLYYITEVHPGEACLRLSTYRLHTRGVCMLLICQPELFTCDINGPGHAE